MTLTPRITLLAGGALILLVNAVALTGVYLNRSGEPESRLRLSERELGVPWDWRGARRTAGWRWASTGGSTAESSGDYYGGYSFSGGTPDWLDEARMAALGFDTAGWPKTTRARAAASSAQLPRDVLLVLELAGPSWQQALEWARENAARHEAARAGQRRQQGISPPRPSSRRNNWSARRSSAAACSPSTPGWTAPPCARSTRTAAAS
jgi:hypothetical protein